MMNVVAHRAIALCVACLLLAGCTGNTQEVSTTRGSKTIECDESLEPAMQKQVERFLSLYPDAHITMHYPQAREAIADFINDSVRVIASAREFNAEELAAMKTLGIEYETYKVALDAIVVVAHRDNPVTELRQTQLDSIFSGVTTTWPGSRRRQPIEVVISDINSSVTEDFQRIVLKGKAYTPEAFTIASSGKLLDYIALSNNAIGIVGLSWLKGFTDSVSVIRIVPDSVGGTGRSYSPAQAYLYQGKYPLTRTVYMYNREVLRDVGLGFISQVSGLEGQKLFLSSGLVPATMPVRLVELTPKPKR